MNKSLRHVRLHSAPIAGTVFLSALVVLAAPRAKATRLAPAAPPVGVRTNPLLPPQIPLDGFLIDLSLVQKLPAITPQGFDPLYSGADWQLFRDRFGVQADGITRLKSSGQIAFAEDLIKAAIAASASPAKPAATLPAPATAAAPAPISVQAPAPATPLTGYSRLLLLRAATIAYRSKDGFPIADKAATAFLAGMDKKSPAQVAALWTLANTMARTSVTPRPDRIRYDAIAAKANMQLALDFLDADQLSAADAITHQVAYHEGWLKSDPDTRARIAQVRTEVKQTATMMDFLAAQYEPAIHNDQQALMAVYLYGRYVKNKPSIVADLPGRIPGSPLAQLAQSLSASERGDPTAAFTAAELLRQAASAVPDAVIRERTLYGSLQLYDIFLADKQTEHDRVHRTLAQIAREGVVADGAKKGLAIDPFAPPRPAQTAPAPAPGATATPGPNIAAEM